MTVTNAQTKVQLKQEENPWLAQRGVKWEKIRITVVGHVIGSLLPFTRTF